MIRKTVKQFRRRQKTSINKFNDDFHIDRVLKTTYWFLFIPIYSTEEIIASNI